MSKKRTIYVMEQGEYSDYTVLCAFEREEDAITFGGDYMEMDLYAPGEQPERVVKWMATALVGGGGHRDFEPNAHDLSGYEFSIPAPPHRPEVTVRPEKFGGELIKRIQVVAADRETALKVCGDTYAKLRAERDGL